MNVQFEKIHIIGFMSLVDETIDFRDLGVVLVKGINNYDQLFKSNGSGKSAIFDSILWCLTGATSRGSSNVVNRHLDPKGALVELTIRLDNDEYIITRTEDYRDLGKAIIIMKNGEDISGSTLTKSKDILKSQLSFVTYDILTSIIILSQGLPGRLSSLRPADRKSRLEYLSNTDGILEEIQNKMNSAHTEILNEQTSCTMEKTKITTSITSNQSTIDSCNRKIYEITTYQKDHSGIDENTISEYNSKIEEYKFTITNMRTKYQQLVRLESDLISKKSVLQNKIDSESKQIAELTTQYKSLSSNVCPLCKSTLQSADDLKKDIMDKLMEHKKLYSTYIEEKSVLDTKVIPDSYKYNESISEYDKKLTELIRIVEEYNRMSSSIDSYETTASECQSKIDELNTQLQDIELKVSEINKQIEIYNFYKSAISRKFRNFLLDGIINYLNKRLQYYSKYLFSNGQVVYLENNGNNINIRLGDSYFEDLSGGEGRRVDIILQLAQRDLSRSESGFSCNLLVLDEILDYLDSDGIKSVLTMLEKESSSVDSLMIVTHKEDVDVPNDSEIVVIKGSDQLSHIRK